MIHSRRGCRDVTTVTALGWVLTTAGPIAAKTITYTPQQVYYTYCFSHPPAARIASGDTVVTKTRDASNDLIQPTDKTTGKLDLSARIRRPDHSSSRSGTRRHVEGPYRQDYAQPQLELGRSHAVLRTRWHPVQDYDDHTARAGHALRVEARRAARC